MAQTGTGFSKSPEEPQHAPIPAGLEHQHQHPAASFSPTSVKTLLADEEEEEIIIGTNRNMVFLSPPRNLNSCVLFSNVSKDFVRGRGRGRGKHYWHSPEQVPLSRRRNPNSCVLFHNVSKGIIFGEDIIGTHWKRFRYVPRGTTAAPNPAGWEHQPVSISPLCRIDISKTFNRRRERKKPTKQGWSLLLPPFPPLGGCTKTQDTPPPSSTEKTGRMSVKTDCTQNRSASTDNKTGHLETYQTARQKKQSRACLHEKVSTARNECKLRGRENSLLMITGRQEGTHRCICWQKTDDCRYPTVVFPAFASEKALWQPGEPAACSGGGRAAASATERARRFYPWLVCGPHCVVGGWE